MKLFISISLKRFQQSIHLIAHMQAVKVLTVLCSFISPALRFAFPKKAEELKILSGSSGRAGR